MNDEEEETYHLLVGPLLEERLKALSRPARDARIEESAGDTPPLCPACRDDLEVLGLPLTAMRCTHAG